MYVGDARWRVVPRPSLTEHPTPCLALLARGEGDPACVAEVGEDDTSAGAGGCHEHVLVLEVAVDDAVCVEEVDGFEELVGYDRGCCFGEATGGVQGEVGEEVPGGDEGLDDVAVDFFEFGAWLH